MTPLDQKHLAEFRAIVRQLIVDDCFELPERETPTFETVFAHDTAHAVEHGISAETCAFNLIESFLETDGDQ